MRNYPKWVYSPRMDVTRNNMRTYDAMVKAFYDTLEERYPEYYDLPARKRYEIRKEISNIVGYTI